MPTKASHPLLTRVGRRLRKARQAKGLTQEGLAYAAGLDRSYVSGFERGEFNVSLIALAKLARAARRQGLRAIRFRLAIFAPLASFTELFQNPSTFALLNDAANRRLSPRREVVPKTLVFGLVELAIRNCIFWYTL